MRSPVLVLTAGLLACLAGCLVAGRATAGAWTLAKGEGQTISTTGRRVAPAGAFFGGVSDDDENSSQVFVEYGVADGWTLGGKLYAAFSAADARQTEISVGLHVRHRVWQRENGDVVSVQAGVSAPVEKWLIGDAADRLPSSVPEAHLRALYGHGWQTGWGNSFVSAETGFHWRGEHAADEWRIDVTAGTEHWKGVMGLLGVHSIVPVIGDGEASLKIAPSVAWTMWPWLGPNDKKPFGEMNPDTVQLGLVYDLLTPGDGLEVTIGIWRRF